LGLATANAAPGKSGYLVNALGQNAVGGVFTGFVASANPVQLNTTGVKNFCTIEDNVVRYKTPGSATAATYALCTGATYSAIGQ
jgi:hypothetical protein